MKRDRQRYNNVVGGDIYLHYGLIFWQECWFCEKEFRREPGYRFQVQVNADWVYSCAECSTSKEHCNANVKEHMLNMRKRRCAPPPPVRP